MHFCQIFGLSKLLIGRENGSQKGITGHEFGSQNQIPNDNLAIKYHNRTGISSQISLPDDTHRQCI